MGSEAWKNSAPAESVPPDSDLVAQKIDKLRKMMAENRKAREGGVSDEIPVKEVAAPVSEETDSDFDSEKVELGNERVSITDYKTISLTTKSGNTYVLRRGAGVCTLFNVRAKSIM